MLVILWDGLDRYVELISELSLPSNFFVLGELVGKIEYFRSLANSGFEIDLMVGIMLDL